jgi:hypothetical protein
MQASRFKKFLKMIFGWLSLSLEVMLSNCYTLLVRVTGFLVAAAAAGRYGDAMGSSLCSFLPPLTPFLALLTVALVGTVCPPLAATLTLPRTKVARTTSSPKACRVAMSGSSLLVFTCLRLSS